MKIAYARVSTPEQNLDLQIDALKTAGADEIHTEIGCGAKTDRPVLAQTLSRLRSGDVLVVWKLDRLGRSLRHLVELVPALLDRGVGLLSLHDHIDTTTPQGRLTFNIFASLAEFERDIIRERTQAGLVAARTRGRLGGRPHGLSAQSEKTACAAETLYREGKLSVAQIATNLHISKSTLYAYLRHRGVPVGGDKP